MTASPAMPRIFVASSGEEKLMTFDRRPDGTLRPLGETPNTRKGSPLLELGVHSSWIAASPDGLSLLASDHGDSSLSLFSTALDGVLFNRATSAARVTGPP